MPILRDIRQLNVNATCGPHAVAAELETADLTFSVVMGVTVLFAGYLVFRLMNAAGLGCERRDSSDNIVLTTVALNYLSFLENCRDMFFVQMLISAAFIVPNWGPSPISMGLVGHTLSTAHCLDSHRLAVLCMDTAIRGIAAIFFVERLRNRIKRPDSQHAEKLQRTLWLTGLPVYDRETGKPFLFNDADFKRVSDDLRLAMNNDLNRWTLGNRVQAEMKIEICPIVDTWHKVSSDLHRAREVMAVYNDLINTHRKGIQGAFFAKYYARKFKQKRHLVSRLCLEVERISRDKKGISGCAFVTFAEPRHRDHFLKEKPQCWQCRNFAFFSFGRPPFASVTLACMRAPHPSDVNWLNLHVTQLERRLRLITLTILLFIVMVTIITPVTITSQMNVILPALKKRVEVVATLLHSKNLLLGNNAEFWYSITNQLPALLLVTVNSLLVPECIRRISEAVRPHKHSYVEVLQLHLNYVFMILNAVVIPLLGLTSISTLVLWGERKVGIPFWALVASVLSKLLQSSGVFAVRYIVNCACLTNTNSMLQLAQAGYRIYAKKTSFTPREFVAAEEQWIFAWGYWYAWTLSLFTLGICLSTLIPSTLPCAALFFTVQHSVDKHNLLNGVYGHGAESENSFVTRALHYMRCIISAWWFTQGVGLALLLPDTGDEANWDSIVPLPLVKTIIGLLMLLAVALTLWSWWDMQAILHDSHFQMVDISKRGMNRSSLLANLDRFLRKACCYSDYVSLGSDDAADMESATRQRSGSTHKLRDNQPRNIELARSEIGLLELILEDGCASSHDGDDFLSWDALSVVVRDPGADPPPL